MKRAGPDDHPPIGSGTSALEWAFYVICILMTCALLALAAYLTRNAP